MNECNIDKRFIRSSYFAFISIPHVFNLNSSSFAIKLFPLKHSAQCNNYSVTYYPVWEVFPVTLKFCMLKGSRKNLEKIRTRKLFAIMYSTSWDIIVENVGNWLVCLRSFPSIIRIFFLLELWYSLISRFTYYVFQRLQDIS